MLSCGSKETKFVRHLFIKGHQNVLGPITIRHEFGTVLQLPPTIHNGACALLALYLCTEGKPYLKTSLILPNSHTIKCRFFSCRLQHFCNYFHVSIRHIFRSLFSFFVHIIPERWIPFTTILVVVVSFLIWYLLEDTESLLYHSHFVWKTLKNITGQTMLSLYIFTHWKATMMKKFAFFMNNRWIKCRSFVILFAHLSW